MRCKTHTSKHLKSDSINAQEENRLTLGKLIVKNYTLSLHTEIHLTNYFTFFLEAR